MAFWRFGVVASFADFLDDLFLDGVIILFFFPVVIIVVGIILIKIIYGFDGCFVDVEIGRASCRERVLFLV